MPHFLSPDEAGRVQFRERTHLALPSGQANRVSHLPFAVSGQDFWPRSRNAVGAASGMPGRQARRAVRVTVRRVQGRRQPRLPLSRNSQVS